MNSLTSRTAIDAIPPASATVVMGTAIICVDLYAIGQPTAATVLLWFAAATWLFVVTVLALRVLYEPDRFAPEARLPAALAGVASMCVLGTAFAAHDYYPVSATLLSLAAIGWVMLVVPILHRWKNPSFLVAVATQGIVVLGATVAARDHIAWLLITVIVAWILGLFSYVLTVTRFDPRQLLTGHGDQWIAGGALAISALASAKIVQAIDAMGWPISSRGSLSDVPLVFWCSAMLWLAPFVVTEVLRPRLSYDLRRWTMVFPLGMYAAGSFAVGRLTRIAGITTFARVWTWIAVVAGLVVFVGLVRRTRQVLMADPGP